MAKPTSLAPIPVGRRIVTTPDAKPTPKAALAKTAAQTGKLVSKASAKVARPLARSLKREEPRTLAKMLLAAAAPRIAVGALRFAMRHPVVAVGGLLLFAAISQVDTDPTEA